MSDKREKLSILQSLTVCNLKEICEKNNLKEKTGEGSLFYNPNDSINYWGKKRSACGDPTLLLGRI